MSETAHIRGLLFRGETYEARVNNYSTEINHGCLHVHIAKRGGCNLFAIQVEREVPQTPSDIVVLDHEERVPPGFKMAFVKWADRHERHRKHDYGKHWWSILLCADCMEWEQARRLRYLFKKQ